MDYRQLDTFITLPLSQGETVLLSKALEEWIAENASKPTMNLQVKQLQRILDRLHLLEGKATRR
jgi:hypothetical protein